MMFMYYGYLLPLSTRIKRGLYQRASGPIPASCATPRSAGWPGRASDTLVIASRQKTLARRLSVPGVHLGEVRHFLREKIGAHDIEFDAGPGIHLGYSRHARISLTANVCNPLKPVN